MGNGSPGAMKRREASYRFASTDETQDDAPLVVPVTTDIGSGDVSSSTLAARRTSTVGLTSEKNAGSSTTKKEFAQWVCAIDPKVCMSFGSGERLLSALKNELCRAGAQRVVSKHKLTTVEALAVMMYSSETKVVGELNTCLKRSGMLEPFEPFLSPLLSGLAKLPRQEGVVFRVCERRRVGGDPSSPSASPAMARTNSSLGKGGAGAAAAKGSPGGWSFLKKNLAALQAAATEDGLAPLWSLGHQETFPCFSSCSAGGLQAEQVRLFGAPRNTTILCIRAMSGRVLGDLSFAAESSREVVLLPEWCGKVVGYVEPSWKQMLSALWGFDVTPYDIAELVEIGSTDGTGFIAHELLADLLHKLEQKPDSIETLRYLVMMYQHLGDKDKERRFLLELLAVDQQDYDANKTLAKLLVSHYKDFDSAWKHYERALQANKDDADTHCALGQLWEIHFKDPKRAKRSYELALRAQPEHPEAHARLGFILESFKDDLERAKNHYELALKADPTQASASFLLGRILWNEPQSPNWERAKKLLETSIAKDGSVAEVHYWLGVVLEDPKVRDLLGAKFQFEIAVHLDGTNALAHSKLGCLLFLNFREPKSALDHLLCAVKMDPNNDTTHAVLGKLYEVEVHDYALAKRHYEMALKINFELPDTHCDLGQLLENQFSDHKKAKKHYEHAIRISPQHADAHTYLGWIIERFAQEPDLAKRHYDISLVTDPSHPKCHHRLGNLFRTVHKHYDLAKKHLELSVAGNPRDSLAHHDLAVVLERHFQDFAEARWHYETSIGIDDANAECHNNFGFLIMTQFPKELPKAQDHFVRAIELFSDFADAHNNLGFSLKSQLTPECTCIKVDPHFGVGGVGAGGGGAREIADAARLEFEHAVQLEPKLVNAHCNLAILLASDWYNESKLSRKHLETALRLSPQDFMIRTNYGVLLERDFNDYRAAVHQYEAAIRLNQFYGHVHNYLGRVLMNNIPCDLAKPRGEFEVALTIVPEDADTHHNLALLLDKKLAKYEDAKLHYELAVKYDPDFAEAHSNLAMLLTTRLGDHARARRHLHLAVKINPDGIDYHKNLAYLLIQQFEDYKNAVRHLKAVIQVDDKDPIIHLTYGQILENYYQEYDLARARYETALKLDPNNVALHNAMALLLRKRFRDTDGAVEHFQEALLIDPTNDCALTNLHRIRVSAGGYSKASSEAGSPKLTGGSGGSNAPPPLVMSPSGSGFGGDESATSLTRLPSILMRQSSDRNINLSSQQQQQPSAQGLPPRKGSDGELIIVRGVPSVAEDSAAATTTQYRLGSPASSLPQLTSPSTRRTSAYS